MANKKPGKVLMRKPGSSSSKLPKAQPKKKTNSISMTQPKKKSVSAYQTQPKKKPSKNAVNWSELKPYNYNRPAASGYQAGAKTQRGWK